MPIFRRAFVSLGQNYASVLLYLCIAVAAYSARLAFDTLYIEPYSEKIGENMLRLYTFSSDIAAAAIMAFIQTIVFSRMGREIDKPMWRVPDDADALHLFYRLWLILNLANIATLRFMDLIAADGADPSTQMTLGMLWLMAAVLIVPFGASVMFYGRLGTHEIAEALSTMMHQLPRTFMIALFGFFASLTLINLQPTLTVWVRPGLAAADAILDCFLFSAMWLVCMYHRDEYAHPDDDDFDF